MFWVGPDSMNFPHGSQKDAAGIGWREAKGGAGTAAFGWKAKGTGDISATALRSRILNEFESGFFPLLPPYFQLCEP